MGGNKVPTGESFLPVDLLRKADEVADFPLTEKRVERPPLLRGNAESCCIRDLGISVSAVPHLKPTATAWQRGGGSGRPL